MVNVCPHCGKEVMEDFDTCFNCGESLNQQGAKEVVYQTYKIQNNQDASFLFLVIAFFFPLIGLIVALLIRPSNERLANQMFLVIVISVVFFSMMIALIAFFIAV